MELEISLVKAFGWSLWEIDETAIESLLPFIAMLARPAEMRQAYADEVDWL